MRGRHHDRVGVGVAAGVLAEVDRRTVTGCDFAFEVAAGSLAFRSERTSAIGPATRR